jgi:hypothetical protein
VAAANGSAGEIEQLRPPHGEKTGFSSHLTIKAIFLPRQARDKHRESTQKKPVLPQPPDISPPVRKDTLAFSST